MRLPQELVEGVIDCLADNHPALETCSLVATTWLSRSRHHLFSKISLDSERAVKWCSAIRPGPDGASYLVRTLALRQARGNRWLGSQFLDSIPDHFPSFQKVETLSITWLDFGDFQPGSLTRHFVHFGSSLRSLCLSYLSADYSAFVAFLQLFPNLEDLIIHTPDLCDDDPPMGTARAVLPFRGSLNVLSFDSASSSFISHLADLDLRFSSISVFHCDFSTDLPLNNLLEASALSLRHLELEYITFSKCNGISLTRCGNLQGLTVGAFEEDRTPSLLFSLLSTLSSNRITHITIDFVAIPSPNWPEWKAIDAHLLQMVERCGLKHGPRVVLRTRLGMPGDEVGGHQLVPKYREIGIVELKFNYPNERV